MTRLQMYVIDKGVTTGPKLREEMESIQAGLNPHPAGQKTLNVPSHAGEQVTPRVFIPTGPCVCPVRGSELLMESLQVKGRMATCVG